MIKNERFCIKMSLICNTENLEFIYSIQKLCPCSFEGKTDTTHTHENEYRKSQFYFARRIIS